jgi:natural product biosynthesis luciferase-like monooxygenase protein
MKFSLFFFSSGEDTTSRDKYRLVIEGTKFADQNGFSSVWIPERHFSAMGCLYPSPQLLLAALARETKQLRLCAGSVSLPLHNPIQIAEDWAMLDNLSGGRVGIACASGWHPNDFVFFPHKYQNRHQQMYEDIETLRKLWRGESIWCEGGDGSLVEVKTYPKPIQSQLPLWIAAGVNPKTFIKAGEIGANLLTHMQLHSPEELDGKIKLYHESLAKHGYDPQAHEITVWVQAFVGQDAEIVFEQAVAALNGWYRSDAPLMFSGFAYLHKGKRIDITQLSKTDFEEYVRFVCDRLVARNMAIFGTPETCLESIEKFRAIGVTEVGCQIDFGLDTDLALQSLPYLKELKDRFNSQQLAEPSLIEMQQKQNTLQGVSQKKDTLQDIRKRCKEELDRVAFYKKYHELGLEYGSSFQGVEQIWRRDGEVLGLVRLPEALEQESDLYGSHPAFIDSCVQIVLVGLPKNATYNTGMLYFAGMRSFQVHHQLPLEVWCHAILRYEEGETTDINKIEGDVTILNEEGLVLAEVSGLRVRSLVSIPDKNLDPNPSPSIKQFTDTSNWLYKIEWQLKPRVREHKDFLSLTTNQPGGWLIFCDKVGVGRQLKSLLEARGETCVTVFPGENYKLLEAGNYQINPSQPEDFQQLCQDVSNLLQISLRGVVHCWSLEASPTQETTLASLETAQKLGCGSVLSLVQALTVISWQGTPRLWLVTSNSQPVTTEDKDLSVAQSPLWGLGKTINFEYPELRCTTVDLSPQVLKEEIQFLFEEFWLEEREAQIGLRGNQRYIARLVQSPVKPIPENSAIQNSHGTYLITGGTGSLGLRVASWMAKQGVQHLVLIGRSGASEEAQKVIHQLQQEGTQVVILKADVSHQEDVARVLEAVKANMPPLRGIVHTAGVLDDGIVQQQNWERLMRVMLPKVQGTWNLHILTQDIPLDFFVCFSSVASLLGSPGQGNYAAANAFMDALVYHRSRFGLPGLSINWGLWAQSAMASTVGSHVQNRIATQGIQAILPEQGLHVFGELLRQDAPQVGVLPVNWSKFVQQFPDESEPSLLFDLARLHRETVKTEQQPINKLELLHQLHSATPTTRHSLLTAFTQELVAKVIGLNTSEIDFHRPLINLGVDSFMSVDLKNEIKTNINVDVPVVKFLEGISLAALVTFLDQQLTEVPTVSEFTNQQENLLATLPQKEVSHEANGKMLHTQMGEKKTKYTSGLIAIIGMTGKFPGAKNVDEFWHNLCAGVQSISFFTDEELLAEGIDPTLVRSPNYVKARGVLEDIEMFDAQFFGFSPREAQLMDPQHRLFLECAWQVLESAGYDSEAYDGRIGVFAGAGINTYLLRNQILNTSLMSSPESHHVLFTADKDHVPTRVSYLMNLTGPSVNVSTACSTSLVAIQMAYQSLLNYQCDMALAGGVSIWVPKKDGYLYEEGAIVSPDGHCRAFDARAQGTIPGSGVGVVVLKRLEDALKDGDCINAVIKGCAINNDGSLKLNYTAPSVHGQAEVIAEAQAIAGVDAETITYIEAHGTGTKLGDPIEITALSQAFRTNTQKKSFCAIGSVKTNVGHLDTASGMAGLIKTVLALQHKLLPPILHFETPNPNIDFANSPFYVNSTLSEWKTDGFPRRAGVSSLGLGGTNAHLILEEAPPQEPSGKSRPWQLLLVSAKTSTALDQATVNLALHLKQHPGINLADAAYTLKVGRKAFNHRRIVVCQDTEDASMALETLTNERVLTSAIDLKERPVVFMFSGQGSQYVNMGRELYHNEPTFANHIQLCAEILKPYLGLDLVSILYPDEANVEASAAQLQQTVIAQPALFAIEYALFQLWQSWGVHPTAMIGHSIGEYVAACFAGVFSVEDALKLVASRAQLMQQMPLGTMLAIPLPENEVKSLISEKLSLAAINGPSLCVVSGNTENVEVLEQQLSSQGVECRRLHTSHAFHSQMMEPILEPFTNLVKKVNLQPPQIPYISNVTGTWITPAQATDPSYWATHLRSTVQFALGLQQLLQKTEQIFLEVGPGRTLSTLAQRHPDKTAEHIVLTSLRHPLERQSDVAFLLKTLGQLWLSGNKIDWSAFYSHERRHRQPLPTYPFERQRYWIEPEKKVKTTLQKAETSVLGKKSDIADWFYVPSWKRSILRGVKQSGLTLSILVFVDECGLGSQLVKQLEHKGHNVITVKVGSQFSKQENCTYTLNPREGNDYDALLKELVAEKSKPNTIVHLWNVTSSVDSELTHEVVNKAQDLGFYSLLLLAQALGKQNFTETLPIAVVSNNMQECTGTEELCPQKATLLGPVKVIPQEYPNITCRSIDIELAKNPQQIEDKLIPQLLAEVARDLNITGNQELSQGKIQDQIIAYRGMHRWVQTFEPVRLDTYFEATPPLRQGGVYLITGGLGGIGLVLAKHLAQTVKAKLVLLGRSAPSTRDNWEQWLATHDESDNQSKTIRKLQELEALGAEVKVISADVANIEQTRAAITIAQNHFGQINGVIHAAGITGEKSFCTIAEIGTTECEQHFQPKIQGLLVLAKVLENKQIDFCLLMSSLSSVLGGLGYVAYSAANLFMDAFVEQQNQKNSIPWKSVNWDAWQLSAENQTSRTIGRTLAELAIKPEEGIKAFQRILSWDQANQVVVSTGNLQARMEQWLNITSSKEQDNLHPEEQILHSRPDLSNSYIAPRSGIEQTIADIWQQLLGIEQVGIYDEFFTLGGHSLLATQIISRMRETFGMELTVRSLFEEPTIAGMAKHIEMKRWAANQLTEPKNVGGQEVKEREEIEL